MKWTLHLCVSLLCTTSPSAERPSHRALALDLQNLNTATDTDPTVRLDGISDDTKPPCPQEGPLKAVLKGLGMNEENLLGVVTWKGCKVTQLQLNKKDLHGSLDDQFRELVDLELLNLLDTNVSGDLAVLKENTKLKQIDLRNTRVSGDLKSLANAKKLWRIDLFGTSVVGDLVALANANLLAYLVLSGTHISGDLKHLKNAKVLQTLDLSGTNVSGDIAAFANTNLLEIDLSDTRVYGDLTSLQVRLVDVFLSGTKVSGDIAVSLSRWKKITRLALSGTKVTGQLTWTNCCNDLMFLDLAWTKISFRDLEKFWPRDWTYSWRCPFPTLISFSITGTHLNMTVGDFLRPFVGCTTLQTLKAADCNLRGLLPKALKVGSWELWHHDVTPYEMMSEWPLSQNLHLLDLASNNVTRVEALPQNVRAVILAGNPSISFRQGVLKKAMNDIVSVNLRNVTFANPNEGTNLLDAGVVKQNLIARTVVNQTHGFACYDLDGSSIQISPEKFAPERLCSCSPGWKGSGAQCQKCPENSFTENYSSSECEQCPPGSKAPAGATSHSSCKCDVGVLYKSNGKWSCGCREHEAFLDETCVKCSDLHLNCPSHGTEVHSAKPLPGFARLENETRAFKCLEPDIRCNAEHVDSDVVTGDSSNFRSCREGYTDIMCMECAPNYFARGTHCEQCHDTTIFSNAFITMAGILVILAAIGVGIGLWMRRNIQGDQGVQKDQSPWSTLKEQLKAQISILLQLCQLWAVLAVLATKIADDDGRGQSQNEQRSQDDMANMSAFWELPYVQALQLSISSLKGAFNLQCKFDGAMVRFVLALVAPVFPLTVMLFCLALELVKPGFGITTGLQALTLFYIGGASSTSSLLSCQEIDGAEDILPRRFVFRTSMPYILCHEESKLKHSVDILAVFSAFCYAVVIPCCLLYLYGRQHVILQVNRTTVALATDQGSLKVSMNEVLASTDHKTSGKTEFTRRLVAAAAAYISVLYRGRVQLRVADGTAIVKQLDVSRDSAVLSDLLETDLLSFIGAEDAKQRAKQLKCRSLCEMLTERVILHDVAPSDRFISGAKNLLLKYALCRNLWMEIVQKLVAVSLVSVVVSNNGLQHSLAITLAMAATSAMVQPYAQPQVNRLHCCSFLCLAVAAVSFARNWVWPGRAALAVPFLLTAAQALKPDSFESLAVRLWQELEPQMETLQQGEPVEVTAEFYNFM